MVKVDTNQGAFEMRMHQLVEEKEEIAQVALHYVSEGQSIVLDHSTTCLSFAHVLKNHFHALTIVTNSMEILKEVSNVQG
ncbi:MAG: DeoR/GlpR transcriptional regulator, partial [Clostridia bacterium]